MSVLFDPITHTYTLDGHTFKYSVTQLIKEYTTPFQAEMIAGMVAKKKGVEREEILGMWELKKNIACDYGNAVDKAIQYYVDYGEDPAQKHLKEMTDKFQEDYKGSNLVSQVTVYNLEKSVCGTVDLIEKLGGNAINIIDVKSNADFYKKGHGKLLAPFNDLENNNLNKYRLQLSLYRDLFELRGIKVEGLEVWHPVHGIIKVEPLNTKIIWQNLESL